MIGIERYNWPGNVRKLENRIKQAVAMANGTRITSKDLQLDPPSVGYTSHTLKHAHEIVERNLIQRTLKKQEAPLREPQPNSGSAAPHHPN